MVATEHILTACKRLEPILVVQIAKAQLVILATRAALVGDEKIFRHRVRLVPVPGIVMPVRPPGYIVLNGRGGKSGSAVFVVFSRIAIASGSFA